MWATRPTTLHAPATLAVASDRWLLAPHNCTHRHRLRTINVGAARPRDSVKGVTRFGCFIPVTSSVWLGSSVDRCGRPLLCQMPPVLLVMDLAGTFAFALNGALTAIRAAHLDIVGVITLGMITAIGGGIIRDVLLGALPPATFVDWRYLAVAAGGGLIAFLFSRWLTRFASVIDVLDAAGLSLFAVTGAGKALAMGVGPAQAIILGAVTGVGGGTVRDVLIQRVPSVLSSGLYAIPALVGAALVVVADIGGVHNVLGVPVALGAALVCFLIRMVGLHFGIDAPKPPGTGRDGSGASGDDGG